jgi:hypothetical protein
VIGSSKKSCQNFTWRRSIGIIRSSTDRSGPAGATSRSAW